MKQNKATLRELFEIVKPKQLVTIRAFMEGSDEAIDLVTSVDAFKVPYTSVVDYLDCTLVTVEAKDSLLEVEVDNL